MTRIYSDKPNLSFWVSELHLDKTNLLFRVTRIIPDMPPVSTGNKSFLFRWLLFSVWSSSCQVSMCVLLLQQTQKWFKLPKELIRRDRQANWTWLRNRPIYTQKSRVEGVITACRVLKFNRKVRRKSRAKGVIITWSLSHIGYYITLLGNAAILLLVFQVVSSHQEARVRVLSERDQSESRMRFCSCLACSSCLLLDA